MTIKLDLGKLSYKVNLEDAIDLSIPVNFTESQVNAYGVPKAKSKAYKIADFVGDTRLGGPCNCEEIKFVPHGNGTHTECVGHITKERISVVDCIKDSLLRASLVTVKPGKNGDDLVINKNSLQKLIEADANFLEALIIRTLPNSEQKRTATYNQPVPPYIDKEAMQLILEHRVRHLLIDLPSVDRLEDGGKLEAHRIFWGVLGTEIPAKNFCLKSITELIFVPDTVKDGIYLLNLQIGAVSSDATPSRPLLYPLELIR